MRYQHRVRQSSPRLLALLLLVLACGTTACAKRSQPTFADEKIPADTYANLSVPLDVREFEVVRADDSRGVFLKLSRLPDAVQHQAENHPARIILSIQGPTGAESPEEVFPGQDDLVARLRVLRTHGFLQVILELNTDVAPAYTVHPMADWVMVRFEPTD